MQKKTFKTKTTNTNQLSHIVYMRKPITVVTNKLMKRLKGFIHEGFKKVKLVDKPDEKLNELYNKKQILRSKNDDNRRRKKFKKTLQ